MFDFEKLLVYKKAKDVKREVYSWIRKNKKLDAIVRDQLKRATLSIPLNIAEGAGRFSKPDRRNFYVIARSSAFECVAIFDILLDEKGISEDEFKRFYSDFDEISRMLFALIKNLQK